jgi:alkyl sulfatase BDS1-like metallo-beta-lactamase superfamily hydrolase
MRKQLAIVAALLSATALASCKPAALATNIDSKSDVTSTVQRTNAAVATSVDLSDPRSFADARRGFIAAPEGQIKDAKASGRLAPAATASSLSVQAR